MNQYLLEIATFSHEGALVAAQSGANRIELCENPADGGTTPSYGMLSVVKSSISIPVFPIIRPRGGDFVYSDIEFDCMQKDIQCCKELGFEGVVFGILDANGNVDIERTKTLVAIAAPMQVTFHRAFDRTQNPEKALEEIIACKAHRILTSGQYPTIIEGLHLVEKLNKIANNRIIIMPGSGLKSSNVKEIAIATGVKEFHTAARKTVHRQSIFSPLGMSENLAYTSVDGDEVSKIRSILDELK